MSFVDRYGSAIRSANLRSQPDTFLSDTDALACAGFASIPNNGPNSEAHRPGHPLAMSLLRLFCGDAHAVRDVELILAKEVCGWAGRKKHKFSYLEAVDLARAVLAWHRFGVCRPCGGHGYELVHGAPSISERECTHCRGAGRVPFDAQFSAGPQRDRANWLLALIEREQSRAGPAAMAVLAERIEL